MTNMAVQMCTTDGGAQRISNQLTKTVTAECAHIPPNVSCAKKMPNTTLNKCFIHNARRGSRAKTSASGYASSSAVTKVSWSAGKIGGNKACTARTGGRTEASAQELKRLCRRKTRALAPSILPVAMAKFQAASDIRAYCVSWCELRWHVDLVRLLRYRYTVPA